MFCSLNVRSNSVLVAILVTSVCLVHVAHALADDDIRTITLSGLPLPGFGADIVTHTTIFRDAVLNNRGHVAYSANLAGPGVLPKNRESYWLHTPNDGLKLLARSGDPAPGRPGEFFLATLGPVYLNDHGDVQLLSHLGNANGAGAFSQQLGDWVWSPDGIAKLAYINERTPQIAHYFHATGSSINELGQQIRAARNQPVAGIVGRGESLWLLDPVAEPQLIAKLGDAAPGLPVGITLATEFSGSFLDSGGVVYRMGLAGPGVNTTNHLAFWLDEGQGNLQLMVRAGQQAPGLPAGVTFDFSNYVFVRALGTGALRVESLLRGPGVTSANNLAIWSYENGSLQLLAREGSQASGLPNGIVFEQLLGTVNLAGPGIDSSNNAGIWLQQHGAFELVVREGDRAPGTPDGVVFATIDFFGSESFTLPGTAVVQNASEQFAFTSYLAGPGVTDASDEALWASDRSGALHLIARQGQELDVDDGPQVDLRIIASIDVRRYDATSEFLNDRGQVLFTATFTDGSKGIFLSNLVAVPEPLASTHLICAAALVIVRRRIRAR